ncbi:MAG: lytic transglycosylase domain-containing protein [Phenylobacterium sp.]|uniref:lytic transglycosylase domain-containing protein n=1 Tax=Phenylobacterium sp. TaxID=1871053 RepID=UPI002733D859|nr:lytic transglycosylase domain-containing protein [Phenylobacterium sp.]MDP3749525.1 lytic transglycosylase domain-containing protein [Phenylobacterium sp.]
MFLTLPEVSALAARCAPAVSPESLLSVVQVESGFNPLAIGVNGSPRILVSARRQADAAAKASALIAAGRSVDLGLAQINSKSLGWLGLSVEAAFDPCRNLAAAGRVLQAGYSQSGADTVGEQLALRMALSRYNTGDPTRGFNNGYVAKVRAAAARIVPAIQVAPGPPPGEALAAEPLPSRPSWDVFGQTAGAASFVIRISTPALTANEGQ